MDFSKMTDEQIHKAIRAARDFKQATEKLILDYTLELEERANAEYERQQAAERAVATRDAHDAAIDYDVEHHAGCCCVVCIEE